MFPRSRLSDACGVGSGRLVALSCVTVGHRWLPQLPLSLFTIDGDIWFAVAVGVCNNPDAIPFVRGIDTDSRNNNRPAGVAVCFQVSKHRVELHLDDASNVLTKHPAGSAFVNNAAHFWPERAVIFRASSLPGDTVGLTRKPAGEYVASSPSVNGGGVKGRDVVMDGDSGEVLGQHPLAPRINLAEADGLHAAPSGGKRKSTNPRKQVEVADDR